MYAYSSFRDMSIFLSNSIWYFAEISLLKPFVVENFQGKHIYTKAVYTAVNYHGFKNVEDLFLIYWICSKLNQY